MWSNDIKCEYMLMFPLKNLACKGLTVPRSYSVSTVFCAWCPFQFHTYISIISGSKPTHPQKPTSSPHRLMCRSHKKCTCKCAPKVHLQVPTKSAPTPHLHICNRTCKECTCRWAPTAHLQVRTKSAPIPSFTYLHPHQTCTYHSINVWTIQMTAHQTRTYMSAPTV